MLIISLVFILGDIPPDYYKRMKEREEKEAAYLLSHPKTDPSILFGTRDFVHYTNEKGDILILVLSQHLGIQQIHNKNTLIMYLWDIKGDELVLTQYLNIDKRGVLESNMDGKKEKRLFVSDGGLTDIISDGKQTVWEPIFSPD